jgi:Ca-activated chloride channel family protein
MTLLAPSRLLLLVPIVALAIAYVVLQQRRRRYAVRFTNLDLLESVAPRRPGWRRHVAAGLAGLAAVLMTVALARPAADMQVATEDAMVVLAIDTSMSMAATDVAPSRMAAAIDEAVGFVDDLPDEFEVGLVAFDGTARVLATPTDDHAAVIAAIEQLSTGPGTAGGDAIETALATIRVALDEGSTNAFAPAALDTTGDTSDTSDTSDAPAATIIMLSDGTTTRGEDVLDAAGSAAAENVPVSTITYGTATGVVTVEGQTVPVPPDTATMAEIADATGGTAFEAASADELRAVYDDLEARVGTTTEQRELALAFVAAAFVALLVAAGAAFVWTGRFL